MPWHFLITGGLVRPMHGRHLLAVFLKFPEPGKVKTRLAAGVGEVRAAAIYRELVRETLRHIPWAFGDVWLCGDPPEREAEIRRWLEPDLPAEARVRFVPQVPGDLGDRLRAVMEEAFAGGRPASLTFAGTDCPEWRWPVFEIGSRMPAEGWDAVFGPAVDGGYYSLTLARPCPELFAGIPWSTSRTLEASLAAAAAAGRRVHLLERRLRDIDTEADYLQWRGMSPDMNPTAAIRLQPLYMDRVWGGRGLETLFHRRLPEGSGSIGESWEVVDRPEAQSVVAAGPLEGLTLHELWRHHREPVFGAAAPDAGRFPLLIKVLDARDTLSIQVHPPAALAAELGGEPKTEMWYIAKADPEAALYAGVKPGVDREAFAEAIADGSVAGAVHRLPVQDGDFIFVPSGRLHAIGAGLLIIEIQQNSDTTYRVFDWNRQGLDGKPRALHVEESLQCIDFTDTAPELGRPEGPVLVACPFFRVERRTLEAGGGMTWGAEGEFSILTVVEGELVCGEELLRPGDFRIIPACLPLESRVVSSVTGAVMLQTSFGAGQG